MIPDDAGKFLLRLARVSIDQWVKQRRVVDKPKSYPTELDALAGVFVTLYKKVPGTSAKELRGCIGLPFPQKPLITGVIDAAVSACKDPRFIPIRADELPIIDIEISVLSDPEEIKIETPKDYLRKIQVGRDGLIIKKGVMSGLLLPQVALEKKWTVEEYLEQLCFKAGLLPDAWHDPAVKVYRFEARIFRE